MRPSPRRATLGPVAAVVAVLATGCGSSESGAVRAPGAPDTAAIASGRDPTTSETPEPATTARMTTTTRPAPATTEPPPPTTLPPMPSTAPTTVPPVVYLRAGDEGPEVSRIQQLLARTGYLDPGYADGVFDRATNRAVLAFQGDYGLVVDGVVGPETMRSLRAAAASIAG